MRVVVIFGTRPEVIKLAPIIYELRRRRLDVLVVSSSQHRELLDLAMKVFDITPDLDLKIMTKNQTLFDITTRSLSRLKDVLVAEKPDCVLAQGDTTTVLAASLASFYLKIPFGHVEAGLRTWDIWSPFPEEANRQMIARVATWNFAPTLLAAENLRRENVPGKIFVTGNTVVDALKYVKRKLDIINISKELRGLPKRGFILVEVHRRESFGIPIRTVLKAVKELLKRYPVVFPAHPNPEVRMAIREVFNVLPPYIEGNLFLIEPVDYLTMLWLISRAKLIITDSGGLQEEAPSFGTPVIVTRPKTERPEGISKGFLFLVGYDMKLILRKAEELSYIDHDELLKRENPYGDGKAAERITDILINELYNKNQHSFPLNRV